MKKITKITLVSLSLLPALSFAALDGLRSIMTSFGGLINQAITIIFALGLLFFLWGLVQFIRNSGDQKMRDDGKKKILWGIIALFVMASIWGIVGFIGETLGIPTTVNNSGTGNNNSFFGGGDEEPCDISIQVDC